MNPKELPSSDLADMVVWAAAVMSLREPDLVIGRNDAPYLRRWYVIPRNPFTNIYLHQFLQSDEDRALHDHPWHNSSLILKGRYIEHTPEGSFERVAGYQGTRQPESFHRIELPEGETAITLFITGPRVREWGFACPGGWKLWTDFMDPNNPGAVGAGCGED